MDQTNSDQNQSEQSVVQKTTAPKTTALSSLDMTSSLYLKVGIGAAIAVFVGVLVWVRISVGNVESQVAETIESAPTGESGEEISAWDALPVEAAAVYVYDVRRDKVLYEKNGNAQLPLASITKIMTALTAKTLSLGEMQVIIEGEALSTEGDSGLYEGERWDFDDLAALTLVTSSNDGAEAIGATVEERTGISFVSLMNQVAESLGLHQTYFLNPTGLDVSLTQAGAYGSARDVAHLMAYTALEHPALMEATRSEALTFRSDSEIDHLGMNTNQTTNESIGLLASKTGFTDLAGGNLVILFDAAIDRPIAVVVLGSSKEGRFTDVDMLADQAIVELSQL